jgi:hypothetical protein
MKRALLLVLLAMFSLSGCAVRATYYSRPARYEYRHRYHYHDRDDYYRDRWR